MFGLRPPVFGSSFFRKFTKEVLDEMQQFCPLAYSKVCRTVTVIHQTHGVMGYRHWNKSIHFKVEPDAEPAYSIAEIGGVIAHLTAHLEQKSELEFYPYLIQILASWDLENPGIALFWQNYLEEHYGLAVDWSSNCNYDDRNRQEPQGRRE